MLPSQRQSDSATLYDAWVWLNKDGWVLTGNCSCMAGLGSSCSHVAAILFKIETAAHLNLKSHTAPTSLLCEWKKSRKHVKPSPMNLINLKPPKKGDLPQTENKTHNEIRHYSTNNPFSSGSHPLKYEEMKALYNINSDLAVFKSIDNSEFLDDACSTSQTETSSETEETSLPEPLTSLYDPSSINMSQEQLTEHCKKLYRVYKHTYSQKDFQNLLEKTKLQSLNPLWMIHRAGRITASIAGEVLKTNLTEITSESLF